MYENYEAVMTADLEGISSTKEFCQKWPTYKPVLVFVSSLIGKFDPRLPMILNWVIQIVDSFCATEG